MYMCVYIYICVHVFMYKHVYIYIYIYICIYTHTHTYGIFVWAFRRNPAYPTPFGNLWLPLPRLPLQELFQGPITGAGPYFLGGGFSWLNLSDKRTTTGRTDQVCSSPLGLNTRASPRTERNGNLSEPSNLDKGSRQTLSASDV